MKYLLSILFLIVSQINHQHKIIKIERINSKLNKFKSKLKNNSKKQLKRNLAPSEQSEMYDEPKPELQQTFDSELFYINNPNDKLNQFFLEKGEIVPSGQMHVQFLQSHPDGSSTVGWTKMNGGSGEFKLNTNQEVDLGQCNIFIPEVTKEATMQSDQIEGKIKYHYIDSEQDQLADISKGSEFIITNLTLKKQKVFPSPNMIQSPEEGANQLFAMIFTEEGADWIDMFQYPEQVVPERINLGGPHNLLSESTAIVLNSECSGLNQIKLISQTDPGKSVFDLLISEDQIEGEMIKAKRGFNNDKIRQNKKGNVEVKRQSRWLGNKKLMEFMKRRKIIRLKKKMMLNKIKRLMMRIKTM